jgi:inhibitor of KinA sporulation pathway (predicted exonuclease)
MPKKEDPCHNEIVEFPVVIIDVKAQAIKSVFHTYVKPILEPIVTPFCTELTGITQEQVDGGVTLQDALKQLHLHLGKEGLFGSEFIFLSCGDFDGRTLKKEAEKKQIFIPNYLKRWLNIKKTFPVHLFDGGEPVYDFSNPVTIKRA